MNVFVAALPRSATTGPAAGWLFHVTFDSNQALVVVASCGASVALSVTNRRTTALWTVPVMPVAANFRKPRCNGDVSAKTFVAVPKFVVGDLLVRVRVLAGDQGHGDRSRGGRRRHVHTGARVRVVAGGVAGPHLVAVGGRGGDGRVGEGERRARDRTDDVAVAEDVVAGDADVVRRSRPGDVHLRGRDGRGADTARNGGGLRVRRRAATDVVGLHVEGLAGRVVGVTVTCVPLTVTLRKWNTWAAEGGGEAAPQALPTLLVLDQPMA